MWEPLRKKANLSKRRLGRLVALALVGLGCNGILGLEAGTRGGDATGGAAGVIDTSGAAGLGMGGSQSTAGTSSTTGGDQGVSGESGAANGGSAGMGTGGSAGEAGQSGAGAGGTGPCSSSLDCRADGFDFCIDGTCADITSNECDVLIGDDWVAVDPDAEPYVVGVLGHSSPPYLEGDPYYWNLVLAMREFGAAGRIAIEGKQRRPVLLYCHNSIAINDPLPLWAALDHLLALRASSVLLLLEAINSRYLVETLVNRALNERGEDMFFLDVGGATGDVVGGLLNLPDSGRLWHMLGDAYSLTFPFRPLVERIEEYVNPGASTGTATEATRLAIVTGTQEDFNRWMGGMLSDRYVSPLRINGMPLHQQPELSRVIPDIGARIPEVAVAEFAPHIVVNFSSLGPFEVMVDDEFAERGLPPPFYVVPFERARSQVLLAHIATRPSLRTRIVGLDFASADDPTLYRAYLERIRSLAREWYLTAPGWLTRRTENAYDAVYYLLYAAVAGGAGGSGKAAGFRRLILGPPHEIGPDGIESVLATLASSETATLSLSGSSGDFAFHAPTGGRIAFSNAWCIAENQPNGVGSSKLDYAFDVLRYDHALGDFTGTFTCFDPAP